MNYPSGIARGSINLRLGCSLADRTPNLFAPAGLETVQRGTNRRGLRVVERPIDTGVVARAEATRCDIQG